MFRLNRKRHLLHMVIKDHVLRYVVTDSSNEQNIEAFGEYILPPDLLQEGMIQDIRRFEMQVEELLFRHQLKKCPLYFCVPDSSVIIRHQQVPAELNEDEIKGHLYLQMGETIHLPFDEPVIDFEVIDETNLEKNVLFVAYPEEKLQQFEESFAAVKLKPVAADLTSLSTYRVFRELVPETIGEHLLLVEWNVDGITLTVFNGEVPEFSRQMKSNLPRESWVISTQDEESRLHWRGEEIDLQAYITDQLAEIERIMSFYKFSVKQGESEVTKVLLTGDWTYFNDLEQQASESFSVPVETIDLERLGSHLPSRYADVFGLTLKRSGK